MWAGKLIYLKLLYAACFIFLLFYILLFSVRKVRGQKLASFGAQRR